MFDTVLVPTDGSEHSIRAAEHAIALARAFDAAVNVLAVVDVPGPEGSLDDAEVDAALGDDAHGHELRDRLESAGRESIEAVESATGEYDRVTTAIRSGDPAEEILAAADERDAGLIAMGTRGRTGLDRFVAGSVTERVVRLSPVPVLTVRATERGRVGDGYDELLVPTDGSDPAAVVVEPALSIAEAFGARVHAVNVVDVSDMAFHPEFTPPEQVFEGRRERGEAATERVAERARERGLDAVTAVWDGTPGAALLGYAEEADVDLIAMGTRGRTGLDRILVGSTTERVVRRAAVPVLAVREAE